MKKLLWYLKQLLPLTYAGTYTIDGKRVACIWRMHFGRCYDVRWYDLA